MGEIKSVDQIAKELTGELQPSPVAPRPLPEAKGVDPAKVEELRVKVEQYQKELSQIQDSELPTAIGIAKLRRDLQTVLSGKLTPREYVIMAASGLVFAIVKGCF